VKNRLYKNKNRTKLLKIKHLYYELINAVENKYSNETRHETALRFIEQAQRKEEFWSNVVINKRI